MRIRPALLALAVTLLAASAAKADPALGYLFGSYEVPYGFAVHASKPSFTTGSWTTQHEFIHRPSATGLEAVGFGAGIGYNGLNAQLDVRSALTATAGTLTFGLRKGLQLGNFEVWGRLGAGPAIVIDYQHPTDSHRSVTGGIQTFAEAGADYFIVENRLALGVKGVAAPSYSWQATFAADFALNLGIRLLI